MTKYNLAFDVEYNGPKMILNILLCVLLLSAPLALLSLKCHISSKTELFECVAEDQVCAILIGKILFLSLSLQFTK